MRHPPGIVRKVCHAVDSFFVAATVPSKRSLAKRREKTMISDAVTSKQGKIKGGVQKRET